jgi:hypothetical protein
VKNIKATSKHCHKLKVFCATKESTNETRGHPAREWKKIFSSYMSNKGLISKRYKECI